MSQTRRENLDNSTDSNSLVNQLVQRTELTGTTWSPESNDNATVSARKRAATMSSYDDIEWNILEEYATPTKLMRTDVQPSTGHFASAPCTCSPIVKENKSSGKPDSSLIIIELDDLQFTSDQLIHLLDATLLEWFSQPLGGEVFILSPFFNSQKNFFNPKRNLNAVYLANILKQRDAEGSKVKLTLCTRDKPELFIKLASELKSVEVHWQEMSQGSLKQRLYYCHSKILAYCPPDDVSEPVQAVITSANFDQKHFNFSKKLLESELYAVGDNSDEYLNRDTWYKITAKRHSFEKLRKE
uniref:Tyrosyl-DNA phosphodiesterase n=1 Tax=Macrostomum lignano TaxID=282301 RepID=A0A1I8G658_9PLAT